jgi:DNA-binding NarL/FixJ family response regulator
MNLGIVDQRALVRQALASLFATTRNHRVVISVPSVHASLEAIRNANPDVMLLSARDETETLMAVTELGKLLPSLKVLLLCDHFDEEFQFQAMKAGAWGSVPASADLQMLEKAFDVLLRGEFWVSRSLATRLLGKVLRTHDPEEAEDLTPREWEILALVARGERSKEIANQLSVSESTVKSHLAAIYRKLRVSTRVAAALQYFQQLHVRAAVKDAQPTVQ